MLQEVAHDNNFNLTETVYSQFTTHHSLKKAAFTLAEVLITLGIIGVVAAITLPTLIKNYQKQVWVTQLKKVVNSIENNNRKLLADEEVDSLANTSMAKVFAKFDHENAPDDELISDLSSFYEKHFLLRQVGKNTDIYKISGGWVVLYSSDGSCVIPHLDSRDGVTVYMVDVNCDKSPNKVGRDRFTLSFGEDGLYNANDFSGTPSPCKEFTDYSGADDGEIDLYWLWGGYACTNEIINDGWKMNY